MISRFFCKNDRVMMNDRGCDVLFILPLLFFPFLFFPFLSSSFSSMPGWIRMSSNTYLPTYLSSPIIPDETIIEVSDTTLHLCMYMYIQYLRGYMPNQPTYKD